MRQQSKQSGSGVLLAPWVCLALCLLTFSAFEALAQQPAAKKAEAKKPANETVQAPASTAPFHAGETLDYRVAWASFDTAASLQVSVVERRQLFGWSTWHFRAALHTQSPVRSLFSIDDEFDSYADVTGLETRRYETYQNEMGRKQDRVQDFLTAGGKAWGPGPDVIVPAGTRDPVGVLFTLRTVDWQRTPEFRAPVYDGHDMYRLSARLDARSDTVSIAAGTFSASRVAVKLSPETRPVADIDFEVWLANDPARTPLQFQARLPFGTIRAELVTPGK